MNCTSTCTVSEFFTTASAQISLRPSPARSLTAPQEGTRCALTFWQCAGSSPARSIAQAMQGASGVSCLTLGSRRLRLVSQFGRPTIPGWGIGRCIHPGADASTQGQMQLHPLLEQRAVVTEPLQGATGPAASTVRVEAPLAQLIPAAPIVGYSADVEIQQPHVILRVSVATHTFTVL